MPRTAVSNGLTIDRYIPPQLRNVFYKNTNRRYSRGNGLDPYGFSTEGLVLYLPLWALNNGGTNSIQSIDAFRHTCDVTGTLWQPNGRDYTGGDDFIDIDDALTPLASTTVGTFLVWGKATDMTPAASNSFITFGDTSAIEYIGFWVKVTTGKLRGVCYDAGALQWDLTTDAAPVANDTWFLAGLVQDGISPVLYVNGVAVNQTFDDQTAKTKWFSALGGLDNGRLGVASYSGNAGRAPLIGSEGEIWCYNRAFSAEEMTDVYNRTVWRYQ